MPGCKSRRWVLTKHGCVEGVGFGAYYSFVYRITTNYIQLKKNYKLYLCESLEFSLQEWRFGGALVVEHQDYLAGIGSSSENNPSWRSLLPTWITIAVRGTARIISKIPPTIPAVIVTRKISSG